MEGVLMDHPGPSRTLMFFYTPAGHCQGGGEGTRLLRKRTFLSVEENVWEELTGIFLLLQAFPASYFFLLFLFPSQPMILAFCPANWRGGGASGGMVLIGIVNWRTPFPNHTTFSHARKFTVCVGIKEVTVLNKNRTVKRPFQPLKLNYCAIVYKL